jgi:hypothetical protein
MKLILRVPALYNSLENYVIASAGTKTSVLRRHNAQLASVHAPKSGIHFMLYHAYSYN